MIANYSIDKKRKREKEVDRAFKKSYDEIVDFGDERHENKIKNADIQQSQKGDRGNKNIEDKIDGERKGIDDR